MWYIMFKKLHAQSKSFLLMLYNIFLDESVGQWLIQNTEQNDSWNDGFSYLKFALQKVLARANSIFYLQTITSSQYQTFLLCHVKYLAFCPFFIVIFEFYTKKRIQRCMTLLSFLTFKFGLDFRGRGHFALFLVGSIKNFA